MHPHRPIDIDRWVPATLRTADRFAVTVIERHFHATLGFRVVSRSAKHVFAEITGRDGMAVTPTGAIYRFAAV